MENSNQLKFDSINEVLNFAIEKEIEASNFYQRWADKVENKAVRQVLFEFSDEELKHRDLLQNVKLGEGFKSNVKLATDLHLTDYYTTVLPESEMSYQDALLVAIQREKGAIELYNFLRQKVEDAELKQLFSNLEQEEMKHKFRLDSIYEEDFLSEN